MELTLNSLNGSMFIFVILIGLIILQMALTPSNVAKITGDEITKKEQTKFSNNSHLDIVEGGTNQNNDL